MNKYNKVFGALVGSLVGLAVAFGVDASWMTVEVQAAIVTGLSMVATFAFPANK